MSGDDSLIVAVVVGVMLVGLFAFGLIALIRNLRHRSARRRIVRAIAAAATATLRDVLLPDGSGGYLHVDFLLLTGRGILVVDLRDVQGIVFGGEHMSEWTVMDGTTRSTFLNPLEGLYDRIAAVKALSGDVPVDGRIVFTEESTFPKGRPPKVMRIASLETEYPPPDPTGANPADRYRPVWDEIAKQLEPSPLRRR